MRSTLGFSGRRLTAVLLAITVAACGGGSSDPIPEGYQRINGRLLPLCTPQAGIRIQLFGDST